MPRRTIQRPAMRLALALRIVPNFGEARLRARFGRHFRNLSHQRKGVCKGLFLRASIDSTLQGKRSLADDARFKTAFNAVVWDRFESGFEFRGCDT